MNTLKLIGRNAPLFEADLERYEKSLSDEVSQSRFLVIGGAGSIGQAVTVEIFKRNPKLLHVVDISENNLVELVRNIRSTIGYIDGEFSTFAIDCGGREFETLMNSGVSYDYILNLSAMKHVRSEKDPYTLMRMVNVNILNTLKVAKIAAKQKVKKYFCVSTDKAANPVNLMGASKRIMELFLNRESVDLPVSTARFANVAFSDGSLLHGFSQRFAKRQPISAPNDVRRYFLTPQESGELCLMSCILGDNRDTFFPKLNEDLHLTRFSDIAERYLHQLGFKPVYCQSEDEARSSIEALTNSGKWPVYFFKSDTTGEKDFEEFYTSVEKLDMSRFETVGVIANQLDFCSSKLDEFCLDLASMQQRGGWTKSEIVSMFESMLLDFEHLETGKNLDNKM
jgi:UDP-N-acetylglucosamine 4,6-dehydratase